MARYIRKFRKRVGMSLGPSEERNFEMWVGYDLVGVDRDLSSLGLIRVDDLPPEAIAEYGITEFSRVEPDDEKIYEFLGLNVSDSS